MFAISILGTKIVAVIGDTMVAELRIPLDGVEEHTEGYTVEVVRDTEGSGRLCVRARNEGGNNETLVDLWGLVEGLRLGPLSDFHQAFNVLARLVRSEYPEDRSLVEIASTWGQELSAKELEALRRVQDHYSCENSL